MLANPLQRPEERGALRLGCFAVSLALAACSGEASMDEPAPDDPGALAPSSQADGSRFLHQATFGPTESALETLTSASFDAWFEHQRSLPPTLLRPYLESNGVAFGSLSKGHRQDAWWHAVVRGEDQLRQRVAFALSQIFVISDVPNLLGDNPRGVAEYYDVLLRGAFGNYRDLMEDVSKSPAMGFYLSHVRNRPADPVTGIMPDENYARELLQLFTLGLVELEVDGTPRLDGSAAEVPTYSQADIEELSRVLTGWTYAGNSNFGSGTANLLEPMVAWPSYHDAGAKVLLGQLIPAGLSPEDDLDAALDIIFAQPTVAPFVAYRLIQRLVTSNPSPAYVARVAAVFADDGTGERGDIFAVIRAVLLDIEARRGHETSPGTFGKLREPLVRLAGIWRLFDAQATSGIIRYSAPEVNLGQASLRSPSVFNFFYPDFVPDGPVGASQLVAPEFQIMTHSTITLMSNEFRARIYNAVPGVSGANEHTMMLSLDAEVALAGDAGALIERLNLMLMGGAMSPEMRTTLIGHVEATAMNAGGLTDGLRRVIDTIYLIVTSPEGAMQL